MSKNNKSKKEVLNFRNNRDWFELGNKKEVFGSSTTLLGKGALYFGDKEDGLKIGVVDQVTLGDVSSPLEGAASEYEGHIKGTKIKSVNLGSLIQDQIHKSTSVGIEGLKKTHAGVEYKDNGSDYTIYGAILSTFTQKAELYLVASNKGSVSKWIPKSCIISKEGTSLTLTPWVFIKNFMK